ncbi:bifunctional RNase H/acid phosphatase [Streptomyces sp. NPDC006193]|uniref:bifunctional RNase H/acid phosphatase n=1 Tax=Streptomyces sp. NPDC006193 TaxID=3155717 RepID=UPI0033AAD6EF
MREFIVEADGGSRGNPGPAGYGAVVRDAATGDTLAETAEYIGVATNNVAEYRGLLAGLRAAHALDPSAAVHVRMDSKLVVEQMSGRWKIKHPDMKPLAAQARSVFPPDRVTYEWIPRERNKHADRLANEAMDAGAKGEPWSPPGPRAASAAPPAVPEPAGPPGDAKAGAARARAALTRTRDTAPAAAAPAPVDEHRPPVAGERRASDSGAGRPPAPGERQTSGPGAGQLSVPGERRASGSDEQQAPALGDRWASGPGGEEAPASEQRVTASGGEQVPVSGESLAAASGDEQAPAPRERRASGPGAGQVPASRQSRASAPGGEAPATSREQRPGWGAAPDLGAPATFVLLRHGETPLTPQKRFSGSGGADPSLSDAGREQARRVAEALARRGTVQAVVASPLARTRETAAVVAGRLGLDVTIDEGLRETDFGAWEGLTFGEVRERYPDDLNAWLADPEARPTGGGESFAETAVRIAATRDKLVAAHAGRTVLLVTHVTPIKTLIRLALGAPPESLFRMELSAASLSAVAYYADGNASVRLFNDTSHLRA